MAFRKLDSHKVAVCTPQLVREFVDMEPFAGDRNYKPKLAAVIKTAIVKGTFRVADFASCYCKATKQTYRVNGKHTALVLSDLGRRLPKGLQALVERYEADTLTDVAQLYATFDHRRSQRTTPEINKGFAGASPALAELKPRIVNVCASGLAFAQWELEAARKEGEDKALLVIEHEDFVVWLAQLCPHDHKFRHMLRASIVAAMFKTYTRNKTAAGEFWQLVADESHASNKHPTRLLARWLLTHDIYAAADRVDRQKVDSPRSMFVRCLVAWNAWRGGKKEVELRFDPNAPTPKVL